jgi:hypothetical protein
MIVLLVLIFLGIMFADFWLLAIFSWLYNKEQKNKIERLYENKK